MATTNKPKRPRAQSREAYRLWFEFLRRAIAEDKSKVRLDLYKEWGDVTAYKSFDAWWRDVGSKVINLHPLAIELVTEGKADDQTYLLRVPKTMTSTEIGNEVRQFLIAHGHEPHKGSTLQVTMGKEIRPQTYRAYLHTYDLQRKLEEASGGQVVKRKDLLVAVRKFYLQREQRYKNSVRAADKLPSALVTAMNRNDLNNVDVLASAVALNAVNRYLREANKLIDSVRQGKFPE
jgi:hypothetical protein